MPTYAWNHCTQEGQRLEDQEFETILSYIMKFGKRKKKTDEKKEGRENTEEKINGETVKNNHGLDTGTELWDVMSGKQMSIEQRANEALVYKANRT